MHPPDKNELASIALRPAAAFATAALEKAQPIARGTDDVEHVLRAMLDELWSYHGAEPRGRAETLTKAEARALPSGRFYFTYQAHLLSLIGNEQPRSQEVHSLLGATVALVSFVVWVMHQEERTLYPRLPPVLGNDIAEVTWETLEIGLATLVSASPDPVAAAAWQRETFQRLRVDYAASLGPDALGARLGRAYFFPETH